MKINGKYCLSEHNNYLLKNFHYTVIVFQTHMYATMLRRCVNFFWYVVMMYCFIQEGPMVEGVPPKEASDRLSIFQTRFDELWRKYQIYTDGEELFGLPVTQYEDLVRIKKEFNLLQKLYGLFNTVMDSIDGYFDILWTEVDIEKINNELLDFQNK